MAHNKQFWTADFAANLYDTKDWFRFAKNWSSYVNGSIVHIPQAAAGVAPVAITGATVYPVATSQVTYTDLTFANKMIAATPRFVSNIDAAEASFDTRSAEMADVVNELKQAISIEVAYGWQPTAAGSKVASTGAARTNIYGKAGKKAITFADVLNARAALVRSSKNVDLNNVFMIVDPIQYADLLQLGEFKNADSLAVQTAVEGYVGQIAGIKVIQRALGLAYTAAGAKPAAPDYTDVYDNTHNSAALLVDASKVGYALGTLENGEIKLGVEQYATGFYNDVLQGHTRVGASALYAANAATVVPGVVAIVEG